MFIARKQDKLHLSTIARLLAATKTEHQVQSALLLDVVVAQCPAVLQLLARKDETLLIWWDTLLVLNLRFDVVDCIARFDFECDGLACECLDEDLHTAAQTKHEMQSGLLLNVVVRESAAVLKLLSGEDEALLVWWDALLVLDLRLDVVDGVGGLNLQSDGLAGQSLDEDLHTTAEAQDEVEGGLLLDVVVGEGAAILQLLAGEDQALLVWRNAFLVLDLALDIVDGVRALDLESDGLAGDCSEVSTCLMEDSRQVAVTGGVNTYGS
jgi:hypothetical protein